MFYFPQAAEYNAALCIDWLTCMAPKNRMVFVYFLVTSLDNEILSRGDDITCYHRICLCSQFFSQSERHLKVNLNLVLRVRRFDQRCRTPDPLRKIENRNQKIPVPV